MHGIFITAVTPFEEMADVAIAIHRGGEHIGILYRDVDGTAINLIHLAHHHGLRNDAVNPVNYAIWTGIRLPPGRDKMIAGLCRMIWEESQNGVVPYAFGQPDGAFDESGHLQLGPGRLGLTCATFVLAVFHAAAAPLVDCATWPQRDGDAAWRTMVLGMLKQWNADPAHIAALEGDTKSVRYHPQEVAGASILDPLPASFADAIRKAIEIRHCLATLG